MDWNYRLFKQDTPDAAPSEGNTLFFVAECYYDENGNPELHSTMEHNHISGSDAEEVKEVYSIIAEAFNAPIIELDKEGNFKPNL